MSKLICCKSVNSKVVTSSVIDGHLDIVRQAVNDLTVNDCTTVGVERLARNGRTVGVRKENKASGNLARLAGAAHGCGELLLSFLTHGRWNEWCINWAWADAVYTDA